MSDSASTTRTKRSTKNGLEPFLRTSYCLTQSRNYDNFLHAIGVANETRQRAINTKSKIKLTRRGQFYTLTTTYDTDHGKRVAITFEEGKPIIRKLTNGKRVTGLFVANENKLEETQVTEDGTISVWRTFTSNGVAVTMIAEKVRCERYYERVRKPQSAEIRSETSRRSFSSSESLETY